MLSRTRQSATKASLQLRDQLFLALCQLASPKSNSVTLRFMYAMVVVQNNYFSVFFFRLSTRVDRYATNTDQPGPPLDQQPFLPYST